MVSRYSINYLFTFFFSQSVCMLCLSECRSFYIWFSIFVGIILVFFFLVEFSRIICIETLCVSITFTYEIIEAGSLRCLNIYCSVLQLYFCILNMVALNPSEPTNFSFFKLNFLFQFKKKTWSLWWNHRVKAFFLWLKSTKKIDVNGVNVFI